MKRAQPHQLQKKKSQTHTPTNKHKKLYDAIKSNPVNIEQVVLSQRQRIQIFFFWNNTFQSYNFYTNYESTGWKISKP